MLTTLLMDRYRLGPLLTHGQHSRIHWAHDTWTSRDVACKVMDYTQSAITLKESVDQQFRLTQELQHPGILQIHDIFHDQFRHTYYIFMDAYLSQSLRQQIVDRFETAHPYDENTIWMILAQMCDVLAYLHSPHKLNCPEVGIVIHRNIRPETIFLSNNTTCILGGMRQAVSLGQAFEVSDQVGDYIYMAPEMLLGHKYSTKVDIFMLGCVLHELCTLRQYRETYTNKQEVIQSLNSFVQTSYPGYSVELARIINLLLDHNPRSRPPADELLKHPRVHKAWTVYRDYLKEHGPIMPPPQPASAFESLRRQVSKTPAYWTNTQQDPLITTSLHQSQHEDSNTQDLTSQNPLASTRPKQQTFKSTDYSNTHPENYGYSTAAINNLQTLFTNVSNSMTPRKSVVLDHQVQLSEDTKKVALTPNATLLTTMPTVLVGTDTQQIPNNTLGTLPVTISDDISWAKYWKSRLEQTAHAREELLDENKLIKDYQERTQKDIFSDMETNLIMSNMGPTPYKNDGSISVKSARALNYTYGKPGDTFPVRPDDKAKTIHDMTDYTRQTKKITYNTTEYKNTLMQKPDRSDISTSEIETPLTAVSPYDHSYCWDPNLPVRSQLSPSAPYDATIAVSHARGLSYSTFTNPEPGENETVIELSRVHDTPYNTMSISNARQLSVSNTLGYRGDDSSIHSIKSSVLQDTFLNEKARGLSDYTIGLDHLSNRSVLQIKDASMQYGSQLGAQILSQRSEHAAWKEDSLSVKSVADPSIALSGDLNTDAFIQKNSNCEINQTFVDKGINCSLIQGSMDLQKNQQSNYYNSTQGIPNLNHYLVKRTYNVSSAYNTDKSQTNSALIQLAPSTHLVDRGNSMPGQMTPSAHLVDRGNGGPGQLAPSTHLVGFYNSII
ncbi:Serine/threonine protein kinase [Giardia duodenalis assemblage B]|uniref:non-specific serine/threonine protein kinase n=1 Tax=Giardia duodenalis assemblage B TaxID=1394984 RepID=A0A132NQ78_GIAIN|nr:Serine/threonine protein kinase [Giardia intestinalis assemblage B]